MLCNDRIAKPNHRKAHVMFASPLHNYRPTYTVRLKSTGFRFLRHLNTSTLACALVIALALLTSIRRAEREAKESALINNAQTEVLIENFSFSPGTLTVPVGATVTWTNHDNVPHIVASADDQFKKSPVLKAGQRFANAFATAGTYAYFCSIHPRMTGKIIVK
jgi:plastocyanin